MKRKHGWIAHGCFALALLGGCATALDESDRGGSAQAGRVGVTAPEETIHGLDDIQVVPKVTYSVPPQYPFTLPRHGIHAYVVLWAVVHVDGTVGEVTVETSTNDEFNQSAIECVKKWRFLPALRNDKPVASRIRVPVEFNKARPKSR